MTFTTHEHIVGPVDLDAGVRRRPEAGLAVARPPWRKVVAIEKLRTGWAIFLECRGHIMFVDSLSTKRRGCAAEPPAEAGAAGPKKMRCVTCAGLEHPSYYMRRKPRPEDLRAVLEGREETLATHAVARANRQIDHLGAQFSERVRRYGVSAVQRAVAEACGRARRAAGGKRAGGERARAGSSA